MCFLFNSDGAAGAFFCRRRATEGKLMKKQLLLGALALCMAGQVMSVPRGKQDQRQGRKRMHAPGRGPEVRHLGTRGHFKTLVKNTKGGKPLVVKFFATWCPTCKTMAPYYRAAKNRFMRDAQFIKVNLDRFKGLARDYAVKGVPTILVIKDGEESDRAFGGMGSDELRDWIGTRVRGAGKRAEAMRQKMVKRCPCGSGKAVKDCGCIKGKIKGKICPCGSGKPYKNCCGMKGKHKLHKRG